MMRNLFCILIYLALGIPLFARHIAGGEMSYEYLGPGSSANSGKYKITLKLYRDCYAPAGASKLDPTASITIYSNGVSTPFTNLNVAKTSESVVSLTNPDPCINNPPLICYEVGLYTQEVELPFTKMGYTISYQRCCRIDNIVNLVSSQDVGGTYTTSIPGNLLVSNGPINNTPKFKASETVIICKNNSFTFDFSATDADGDQLEYSFDNAYTGGTASNPAPSFASAPPYNSVPYAFGFSTTSPLGQAVTINPSTGIISGIGPGIGIYVITVAVTEKRGGAILNIHRKDLHIKVADCTTATPDLDPTYVTCDGFSLQFKNNTSNPAIKSYTWDFGFPVSDPLLISSPSPTVTYPSVGDYTVTVTTNKGQPCSVSKTTIAKVYPGFNVQFNVDATCQGVPYTFTDKSTTNYGTINSRHWDFGEPGISYDTANTPISNYIYNTAGNYSVTLTVTNTIGCKKTSAPQTIIVDTKPQMKLTHDTLICSIDTLQLLAAGVGAGTYSWIPNYKINNTSIQNPIVSPKVPTKYIVTFTQAPGCVNIDSVFVDVRDFVTLDAGMDTTICLGDSIRLSPLSDGLSYTWSPASTVSNPTAREPWAKPTGTTRYSVIAKIGKCQANDGFVVYTVPYPKAYAGKDTSICFGDIAQLQASGGIKYLWFPANTLDNNTLQNPKASPKDTTQYIVGVYQNGGCPKPAFDTVLVKVVPQVKIISTNDTAVVIGQPLQLIATGALNYSWTPTSFLNDPFIFNPVAKLNDAITYTVKGTTVEGCFSYDDVKVKVYKTPPEVFIPTAFTPNGDGLNDELLPIPVGIGKLIFFKVYNRYGQLVFSTSEIGKGWNGIYKGRDRGNELFVWQVAAIDYLGKPYFKKGETTLIR